MQSLYVVLFCLLAADQILGNVPQSRIIGTDIDDANDALKNTVAFVNSKNKIICSGSFIHTSWIVTSAWCARKLDLNTRYLLSGKIGDAYEKAAMLNDIRVHEQFNQVTMVNDIGLVQVAVPVVVQINLIPRVNKDLTDLDLTVRGLGLNGIDGTPATKLREETVQVRDSRTFCAKYGIMPANTICTRFALACLGDSGGPLLEKDNTIWGVISINDDDAEMCQKSILQPSPRTVYTLLFPYRLWIQKITGFNI